MSRLNNNGLVALAFASGLLSLSTNSAFAGDASGILKSQTSFNTAENELQQQEWQLDMEYDTGLWGGDLNAIGRIRLDTVDDLNQSSTADTFSAVAKPFATRDWGSIELRELYWETFVDNSFWRIGKQQVVWGEADGLKLLDVINPQNFRQFVMDDFDDSRIPLWMFNAEFTLIENGVLQVLWIPDTTVHNLVPSGSPYAFSSSSIVPILASDLAIQLRPAQAPRSPIKDSDIGLRYTDFVSGWDISLNYLYHYVDELIVSASAQTNSEIPHILLTQNYERSHLLGGTATSALGDWTIRVEIAFETNRYHRTKQSLPGVVQASQWSSVIGVDYQGWSDQFISVQWFQTRINATQTDLIELIEHSQEDSVTFLWESNFMNDTLKAKWLQIHSIDHGDGVFRPKVSYNLQSNLDVYISADVFYGNKDTLFGQFDQGDRVSIGFDWGF
ncbi:MAG: hypothetical protein ACI9XK_004725 [Granulosicoccus sp.]